MKPHLYEFRADAKKLRCRCGWERTLKRAEVPSAYAMFTAHVNSAPSRLDPVPLRRSEGA